MMCSEVVTPVSLGGKDAQGTVGTAGRADVPGSWKVLDYSRAA